jgi:hypothetical protein
MLWYFSDVHLQKSLNIRNLKVSQKIDMNLQNTNISLSRYYYWKKSTEKMGRGMGTITYVHDLGNRIF